MKNNKNLHEGMTNAAALSDEELGRVDGGVFLMPELEELILKVIDAPAKKSFFRRRFT